MASDGWVDPTKTAEMIKNLAASVVSATLPIEKFI
jgi:hypothetical protein